MKHSGTMNRMKDSISSVGDVNYEKLMRDSSDKLMSYVEEYPLSTVLTALSGGIILGAAATMLLMPRSRHHYR